MPLVRDFKSVINALKEQFLFPIFFLYIGLGSICEWEGERSENKLHILKAWLSSPGTHNCQRIHEVLKHEIMILLFL